MERVLVTGGAGFIGSHLVAALLEAGKSVRVLDDLSSGSLDNLAELGDDLEVVVGDVRDAEVVERTLAGVDAVCHLAAVVSVARSFTELELVDDVNVGGTLCALDAARRLGVNRFVLASSAAVYGDVHTLPVPESAAERPLSPYGAGKLAAEAYARALAAQSSPDVVALRFFNVYGPRQDPSSDYAGVIARFLDCAARGQPFTVFGDGAQTRDFVYVGDVVRAVLAAAELPSVPADGRFAVINVGSGRETSVLELAEVVASVVAPAASSPEVAFAAPRPGDIRRSVADIGLARSLLGYQPCVSLAEGLGATWKWWQKQAGRVLPAG